MLADRFSASSTARTKYRVSAGARGRTMDVAVVVAMTRSFRRTWYVTRPRVSVDHDQLAVTAVSVEPTAREEGAVGAVVSLLAKRTNPPDHC